MTSDRCDPHKWSAHQWNRERPIFWPNKMIPTVFKVNVILTWDKSYQAFIQSNVTWPTLTNLSSSHSKAAINWVWLWSGCVKSTSTTMQIWTVKEADYIIDPCSLKIGSEHPSQTVRILWRISNFWRPIKTGVVVVLTQLKGWGDSRAIKILCSWFHEICGNQKLLGMFRISVLRPILAEDNLYYFAFHQLVRRESHNNGCHIKVY